jgi:ABC-2 type transport system ATP-binding protein
VIRTQPIIELSHLSKTFRVARRDPGLKAAAKALFRREYTEIRALDDLSFSVPEGQIVGYIGPNGAGKSSTVKVMSGILTPDAGTCRVCGLTPWRARRQLAGRIGVVFGQRSQLFWDVPVIDSFELLRDIYAAPQDEYAANLARLTDLLDLSAPAAHPPARQLSLGQRMRCELAASLLHSPQVLFLDEPTIGLDAVSKIAVRQFIRELQRRRGTTVVLTTHDMQDIEALADRILLIGRGAHPARRHAGRAAPHPLAAADADGRIRRRAAAAAPRAPPSPRASAGRGRAHRGHARAGRLGGHRRPLSAAVELHDLSVASQSAEELVAGLYRELEL